ncbi:MAG TPA: phytanoyl-CoA dioxygenase family protein [Pyrinomonadaceae bacterium]|nr:phytanoyl-CoA dioxygenase family protein [Pyrinomonadaceae bacterium]
MREEIRISEVCDSRSFFCAPDVAQVTELSHRLHRDGLIVLPSLVDLKTLRSMQKSFEVRLQRLRWNNYDGYQKTEPYRHLVEDVLTLDQGFVDLVLHPLVKAILNQYLGDEYELTEAKGWKSLPTKRDFHGWHGDAWYDRSINQTIQKEVKLAIYLSDVRSGGLNYIKGSHQKQHPRIVANEEVRDVGTNQIFDLTGPAGTALLFDTSGIHRQGVPMLEERRACFFNYHKPSVALQREDLDYYRYHPLMLNAAFLGSLSREDERILGFGNKQNYQPAFVRAGKPSIFSRISNKAFDAEVAIRHLKRRAANRLRIIFG